MSTALSLARAGVVPYRPTYAGANLINGRHRQLLEAPLVARTSKIDIGLKGSLRREDAAKLYELAYFSSGDILELGTNFGLSASILGEAKAARRRQGTVHTIEYSEKHARAAAASLKRAGLTNVIVHHAEACAWLEDAILRGTKFGFVFVDHSHRYEDVRAAASLLERVMEQGSYVAFHDFIDHRNFDSGESSYGVYQGVVDGLPETFSLVGGCGCMAIYQLAPTGRSRSSSTVLPRLMRLFGF